MSVLFWALPLPLFSNPALVPAVWGKVQYVREEEEFLLLLGQLPIHVSYFGQFFYLCLCGPGTWGVSKFPGLLVSLTEARHQVNTKESISVLLELQQRPHPAANSSGQAKGPDSCSDSVNILFSK